MSSRKAKFDKKKDRITKDLEFNKGYRESVNKKITELNDINIGENWGLLH